jgi:hypothetical protein
VKPAKRWPPLRRFDPAFAIISFPGKITIKKGSVLILENQPH